MSEYAVSFTMSQDDTQNTARFSPEGTRVLISVIGVSCACVILYSPQSVAPSTTPPLVLEQEAVASQIQEDQNLEGSVPQSETVVRIERVYQAAGLAELGAPEEARAHRERMAELSEGLNALEQEAGSDAVNALRCRMTSRGYQALLGQLPDDERRGLIGTFGQILERYSAVREGRLLAPEIVFRSLYKARWNGYMSRELTAGLSTIELQAYWGWLALHAQEIEVRRRLNALDQYEAATGTLLAEARAALLFQIGAYPESSDIYDSLHRSSGSLRYRNHALAAVSAAQ